MTLAFWAMVRLEHDPEKTPWIPLCDEHYQEADPKGSLMVGVLIDGAECELCPSLLTSRNEPEIDRRIKLAAHVLLDANRYTTLSTHFEHGHWWVLDRVTGAGWSVEDAEGPGSEDGFCFEMVCEGEDLG